MYHSRVVIYFSGAGLYNSVFSTYSFGELVTGVYLFFVLTVFLSLEFGIIDIDIITFVQQMGGKFAIIIIIVCAS